MSARSPRGFGPARRVRKRSDFANIRAQGQKVGATRHFTWVAFVRSSDHEAAESDAEPRLGVVVSTRAGGAAVRNRIKRWCRELFRVRAVEVDNHLDLLVIYRVADAPLTFEEARAEWERGLSFVKRFVSLPVADASPRAHATTARKRPPA